MNKSAVIRLKFSFPNVSGLALHQWNYQFVETVARFIYAIKINGFQGFVLSSCGELLLCTRRNGEADYFFPGTSCTH